MLPSTDTGFRLKSDFTNNFPTPDFPLVVVGRHFPFLRGTHLWPVIPPANFSANYPPTSLNTIQEILTIDKQGFESANPVTECQPFDHYIVQEGFPSTNC